LGIRITYVGFDVHKDEIAVALAEGGLRGEVREYGRITNTLAVLRRLAHKLGQAGVALRFCYEAGPCGYGIQRQLSALARECIVAPSLIPNLRVSLAIADAFHYGALLMTQTVILHRSCSEPGAAEQLIRGGTKFEQKNATEAGGDELPPSRPACLLRDRPQIPLAP